MEFFKNGGIGCREYTAVVVPAKDGDCESMIVTPDGRILARFLSPDSLGKYAELVAYGETKGATST